MVHFFEFFELYQGSHSEICKYELFRDWIQIYTLLKEKNIANVPELEINKEFSYHFVKKLAVDYQIAKVQVS